MQGGRHEGGQIDLVKAQADAKILYEAGAKKWGTDEATFISIFALRSLAQLKVTFEEYKRLTKKDIESVIKDEMSGNLETSFLAIGEGKEMHAETLRVNIWVLEMDAKLT